MTEKHAFLLEIGTEELPPKALTKLSEQLKQGIQDALMAQQLDHGKVESFATPRRLAVLVHDLITKQPDQLVEKRGPAIEAAYDAEGNPTKACWGFARSCGATVDELETLKDEKGNWVYFKRQIPGQTTTNLLPEIVKFAINRLAISKPMRWNHGHVEFVRPAHWIVMMYDKETLSSNVLGLKTSNKTYGHRYHHSDAIEITTPQHYAALLKEQGYVIAKIEERKQIIREEIKRIAAPKGQPLLDESLIEEVAGLVEWPVGMLGQFDKRFLDVPAEALICAMNVHQKSFPIVDAHGKLQPCFVTISNIESKNPAQVVAGYERVIKARLSDAEFFFHTDSKHKLDARLDRLKEVVFQARLGSLYDKAERIAKLSRLIARSLNADEAQAERAAWLAKADLVTEMVGEFPELQGIMGYYYAERDGEAKAVALAIREHYLPRFAGDRVPSSLLGSVVAIADRIDTLVGIFGINQAPTGEKDPFALRRAALGLCRIVIENKLSLDLKPLLEQATHHFETKLPNENVIAQAMDFILERLRAWYQEQNISSDVINAVMAKTPTDPSDFDKRIHAVEHFRQLPEAHSLAAANKRVSNILKKQAGFVYSKLNPNLLKEKEELDLAKALEQKSKEVEALFQQNNYTDGLARLAALQAPIDAFFDHVMVMVDDEKLRHNRIALLTSLRELFMQVADISLLA